MSQCPSCHSTYTIEIDAGAMGQRRLCLGCYRDFEVAQAAANDATAKKAVERPSKKSSHEAPT